jgi:FAD/FMN-containing dehydrogenase/Fe-S oxidoreductase
MDVIRVVEYAIETGIPITARGGGTSRTGNELGEGIILDFSRYMNRMVAFNPSEKWIRVQPGLILSTLNGFLRPHGLFFPIDPSTGESCTLGGMISNNSSGPHGVRYGTTRDYVLSLEMVLASGEIIRTGPENPEHGAKSASNASRGLERTIYEKLPGILERYREFIEQEKPFTTKDSSGYHLWRFNAISNLDLTSLIVGSEGTLAIITEATLKLEPLPVKALSGLIYFNDLIHLGKATQEILELDPSMVEILERHVLDLARAQKEDMGPYLPEEIAAILYVEFQGDEEAELQKKFLEVEKRVVFREKLALDLRVARNQADMEIFSKVRGISGPILNRVKGALKPVAFIEDAAVHPSLLPEYIQGLKDCFKKHGFQAAIYGHAGDGNLHTMVFMDLRCKEHVKEMVSIAHDVYDLVLNLKGTISGEHGDGRTRTYYLRKQYPNLYQAFAEIKALFDPHNLLNPGIIVGPRENPLNQNLKFVAYHGRVLTGSLYDEASIRGELETCSGCAKCRSYCPVAQNICEEWAMGRGKITLLREILSGHLNPDILQSADFKEMLDSCINCKRCLKECPSGVDIPWLTMVGRTNYLKKRGESLSHRVLSSTRFLCRATSVLTPIANLTATSAPLCRFLERSTGIDRRRFLPSLEGRTLRKRLKGRTPVHSERQVVLFPGCYGNYNAPVDEVLAALYVLEASSIAVLLPDFRCCGMARISAGAMDRAMGDIRANMDLMASFAENGMDILFTEPSCALAIRMEYPRIMPSETSRMVAEKCYDIHQYLLILRKERALAPAPRELRLTVGYHNPCHLRALNRGREVVELLEHIPGLRVHEYSDNCCGLGGLFGMKKGNFELSMEMGDRLFQEIRNSTVERIVTSCSGCALQIYQGTGRRALHPLSLLAMAYRKGLGW